MNNLYKKAKDILTSQGKFHICLGLERISTILKLLENPQKNLKIIHVAGTNGKGSTCAILEAVLRQAGYKTGLYTSPHLFEYTERLKFNGQDISEEKFAEYTFKITDIADNHKIYLTEFEILTAMAFLFFKDEKVDFVVLETGLGGRFDATNICSPVVSVVSDIGLDHVDRLGDTIDEIAFEKAGIIKENTPIVTLKDNAGLLILKEKAQSVNSNLFLANAEDVVFKQDGCIEVKSKEYEFNLLGLWQKRNLALALKTFDVLKQQGFEIPEKALVQGLKTVEWKGRFQYIKEKNLIVDGAHNPMGARALRESLDFYFFDAPRLWIYSSINTKDYELITKILFKPEDIVLCIESGMKNSVSPNVLKNIVLKNNLTQNVYAFEDFQNCIKFYEKEIYKKYLKIFAGSLYSIARYKGL